ncbi:hypothetical protein E2C01_090456 [Portunus trituberculatus]|uniref:Uncharacterized protein n=1 Tax=Portunus trituberculatus TaxID=210409 RepID=A0A5B7JSI3_PORTR|nr:hypothetical protein [Portunus trituberculatus]
MNRWRCSWAQVRAMPHLECTQPSVSTIFFSSRRC